MERVGIRGRSMAALLVCVVLFLATCTAAPPSTPKPSSPYRLTGEEFLVALAACMQDKGYNARVDEGGLLIEREHDGEAVAPDIRACKGSIDPARLEPPPPLTASQLEAMYRYVVAQTECMRAAGYPVSDPPPLQVYVDSDQAFDPYSDLRLRGIDFSHADLLRCQDVEERPDFLDW